MKKGENRMRKGKRKDKLNRPIMKIKVDVKVKMI